MIARRVLAPLHAEWNRRWGAPFGSKFFRLSRMNPLLAGVLDRAIFAVMPSLRGPFGFQGNNTTRTAEYPWAFHVTPIAPGLKVLDLGGGLSGFQFVLDRYGCKVVNVDPGMDARGLGWPVDAKRMARLNRAFGTSVTLHNCFLHEAPLEADSFDRIFSISVLEHIPAEELPEIMRGVYRLLKPGGFFVITLDLFLNLRPFCSRESNEFGSNMSTRMLVESTPMELVHGDRTELYGFPEFDRDKVLANLETLMLGEYPALAQLVVLRKHP